MLEINYVLLTMLFAYSCDCFERIWQPGNEHQVRTEIEINKLDLHTLDSFPLMKAKGMLPMNSNLITPNKIHNNKAVGLPAFVEHLKKKGVKELHVISRKIKKHLKPNINMKDLIIAMTDDYQNMLQNYYEFISKDKVKYSIKDDNVYLDIVETSTRLLLSYEMKLLSEAGNNLNSNKQINPLLTNNHAKSTITERHQMKTIKILNETIFKQAINHKKESLAHICKNYDICRDYPAFPDYCTNFINAMLKVPGNKLKTVIKEIANILKKNSEFINTITEYEDRNIIEDELNFRLDDSTKIKEMLTALKRLIGQRFKILQTHNIKTKAMRVLLDILDKLFEYDIEGLIAIDFDNTIKALTSWAKGKRHDIDTVLNEFIQNHLFRTLKRKMSSNTKNEVKVLIEVIMRGRSNQKEVYDYLMTKGSKYVQGEDPNAIFEMFL